MENKEIINLVMTRLTEEGMWFTTKNDPTFCEAPSYYELDQYGDPTEATANKIAKEVENKIGDGAVGIDDAIEIWIAEQGANYKIAFVDNLVTNFEAKPVVDQIEAYDVPQEMPLVENVEEGKEDKLTESAIVKNRLKEENTKSLNDIGAKLSDPDFDADSEDGQIVLRTSQLFNELSDQGLEVQVSFDNGESQSTITVPQGGQINITIRSSKEPLKAFISGQVEIDSDLITTMTTINDVIDNI